jgi:hypothetical protein
MPTQRKIRWKRQWGDDDRIVWVIIAKLDAHWRMSEPDAYLKCGQGRQGTFEYLDEATAQGIVLNMPHVGFWWDGSGRTSFTDGRHRFSWVRDHGGLAMPVTFHRTQAKSGTAKFGSRRRVCTVKISD